MNNIGIGDQAIESMRLGGIGWIFAFFVDASGNQFGAPVGCSAGKCGGLRGSWAANRNRKIGMLRGSGSNDGGTGEPPRG